jgi:hypothetical protein
MGKWTEGRNNNDAVVTVSVVIVVVIVPGLFICLYVPQQLGAM